MPVTVARGAAPQHVIEVLKRVAANQPGVTKEPAPQAYAVSFVSAAVSFNLRAWTDQYEDWIQVRSDLAVAIDEALIRENIAIARAVSKLKLRSTILDGEVVAVDENGIPRFQLLQRFQKQPTAPTVQKRPWPARGVSSPRPR